MAEQGDGRRFVYRADAQNRITFVNRDWLDFARENLAGTARAEDFVGRDLEEFIVGWAVRHLYGLIYCKVRQGAQEFCFPFRCDSPAVDRFMEMRIVSLAGGALEFNTRILREVGHPPISLLDPRTIHSSLVVVICSWCKRMQTDENRWAEIREVLARQDLFAGNPPSLTHGICPDCMDDIYRRLHTPQPS